MPDSRGNFPFLTLSSFLATGHQPLATPFMTNIQTNLTTAIQLHQTGDFAAAEPLYQRVLQAVPHHLDAMYLLGTLQLQRGRFAEAVELLAQVCAAQPDAAALNNLGITYKALGQLNEAVRSFQRTVSRDADYAEAHFNLGEVYQALRRWPEAEACFQKYLNIQPDDLEARVQFGFLLTQQEKLDEAAAVYEAIVEDKPDYAEVHNNLSYVYERRGELTAAVAAARRAVALRPDYADGHNNLGNALRSMHALDEAVAVFEEALVHKADFPLAQFNLATTRMLAGELRAGWKGFEAREAIMPAPVPTFSQPRWRGERLPGKTLLVHADEGLGDTLQFARFLPQAKTASAAKIVLQCQRELGELLAGIAGADQVIVDGDLLPSVDAHIPLLSLPGLFEMDSDSLPSSVSYIQSAPNKSTQFTGLFPHDDTLKVGIVWQGNPAQPRDVVRSCPLEKLSPLTTVPGIKLVSLQTGTLGSGQLAACSFREQITDVGSQLRNFAETAVVIEQLDLVITVDTSTAHLAGAMGAPVWTLLAHTPDWRWLLNRADCPWYPTMQLFRQESWGDWDEVIQRVVDELGQR